MNAALVVDRDLHAERGFKEVPAGDHMYHIHSNNLMCTCFTSCSTHSDCET